MPLKLHPELLLGLGLAAATAVSLGIGREVLLTGRIDLMLAQRNVTPAGVPAVLAFMLVGNGAAEELYWRGLIGLALVPIALSFRDSQIAEVLRKNIGSVAEVMRRCNPQSTLNL